MEIRQSVNPRFSRLFIARLLAALNVAPIAELIDTPTVKLWKSPGFVPTPDTLAAAFIAEVADFTDYAAQPLTIEVPVVAAPYVDAGQGAVTFHIEDAGAITGNTVYGYWVEDASGVVAYEAFPAGEEVSMAVNGATLLLSVVLPFPMQLDGFIE